MANLVGNTLLDQYRVDAFIASGGKRTVYRVWDLKRNVPLAMKVLHSGLAEPHVFKRFKREANALRKLTHPNIIPFYGLYQTLDITFLLEYFADGPSLKEILRQHADRPLPIDEVLIFAKAVGSALGYAHVNGVIHCNVQPGNILVDHSRKIFLTDFGIIHNFDDHPYTLGIVGTPAYMATEQFRGESVTPATDVYALGVVLFEMLTGQHPFFDYMTDSDKFHFTQGGLRWTSMKVTKSPLELNPSLPKELSLVLLKALEKQHENRFNSVQEFFEHLLRSVNKKIGDIPDFLSHVSGDVINKAQEDNKLATPHAINVFLCHASEDKLVVNELYQRLRKLDWINPWLDKEELLLGQDFDLEIEKTIASADVVIAFISKSAAQKIGYVQKELRLIFNEAMYRPEDVPFAIPLRLEKCDPPYRFKRWHWGDYFGSEKEKTYESLLKSLRNIYERSLRIDSGEKTD